MSFVFVVTICQLLFRQKPMQDVVINFETLLSWNWRRGGFIKNNVVQMLCIHLCKKVRVVHYQGNSTITPLFVLTVVFLRNSILAFAFRFYFLLCAGCGCQFWNLAVMKLKARWLYKKQCCPNALHSSL